MTPRSHLRSRAPGAVLLAVLGLGCIGAPASAQKAPPKAVQGIVSQVTDGDTLWLKPADGKPIEVRLRDIDAPEICQPWGAESRQALAELAQGKVASLQSSARDKFGRAIGVLTIDDLNVGRWLVENGHAWSVRSRWDQGPLVKQEKMARALTRGLHSQPGAVQPWEWRRTRGACPAPEAAPAAPAAPKPAR